MKVPFTTADFLDRAVAVYPLRTGVVDEPGPERGLDRVGGERDRQAASYVVAEPAEPGLGDGGRFHRHDHAEPRTAGGHRDDPAR